MFINYMSGNSGLKWEFRRVSNKELGIQGLSKWIFPTQEYDVSQFHRLHYLTLHFFKTVLRGLCVAHFSGIGRLCKKWEYNEVKGAVDRAHSKMRVSFGLTFPHWRIKRMMKCDAEMVCSLLDRYGNQTAGYQQKTSVTVTFYWLTFSASPYGL